ncbi:hypothetical protein BEN83_03805 [Ligilactobacillus agilis]|nr:hypothetical protein BEN83_03805 [Ligilactobacillus agilis]
MHVEIEVGDDTLVLQNNLEYIVDCKNDKELYEEIKGMFIDTADWFKKNNRLDDLVNANEVFAKREEVFWGE